MERRQSSTETETTSPVTRPESAWTDESNFADSAVDMDATTALSPKVNASDSEDVGHAQSLSPISQSIADRMRRLAATIWTMEQDDEMTEVMRMRVEDKLRNLEAVLDYENDSDAEAIQRDSGSMFAEEPPSSISEQLPDYRTDEGQIDESNLYEVHDNLAALITSMRLRQQEQQHLRQLTVTKIEAVAQKCLFQEQQMQNLTHDIQSLRLENRTLGEENDRLKDSLAEVESEAFRREVAVNAMTSAVAGLEGWIDDADKSRHEEDLMPTPPARGHRQRRTVVRGKSRFRGRYYMDEGRGDSVPGSPDAQDLQDGVRAWIRGFRDVEDACSSPVPGRVKDFSKRSVGGNEDDWGDFESPDANPF